MNWGEIFKENHPNEGPKHRLAYGLCCFNILFGAFLIGASCLKFNDNGHLSIDSKRCVLNSCFFLQQKMVCSRHISGPWQVATGQRNHCPVTVTSLLRQNAPLQTTAVCWGSVGNPAAYHDWGWFYNVLICFIQPITILILGMVYYLLYPDILMVYHPSFSSNMAIQGEFPIFAHTHTMIFFPVDTLMPPILRYATSLRYSYSI